MVNQDLIDLATAFRNGEDCGFALHDALCEAGYPKTAAWHFSGENRPICKPTTKENSGCSVVAAILGTLFDGKVKFTGTLEEMEASGGA